MKLAFDVQVKIQKPVKDVFDAVYDPAKLSAYFTKKSSGPLVEGTTVFWSFPDVPGEFAVNVVKCVSHKIITLEGKAHGFPTWSEISFQQLQPSNTLVKFSETGWPETQQGLDLSYKTAQGWMQMGCCLKAWLEYGINLRKGFY